MSTSNAQRTGHLRTFSILSSPYLVRFNFDNSPNLSVKRKTAVELLEESKAFYVKSERVLDSKQELPHSDRLQVRSPMLGLSPRMRDNLPFSSSLSRSLSHKELISPLETPARRRDSSNVTAPVEKRRLAIRKDNPLLLNVTAVKRLLSRPEEALQFKKVTNKSNSQKIIRFADPEPRQPAPSLGNGDKFKGKTPASDLVVCTCQSIQPPELPHRMTKNPSPPPPLPPKSPALTAKLRQIAQQLPKPQPSQQQQHQHRQPPSPNVTAHVVKIIPQIRPAIQQQPEMVAVKSVQPVANKDVPIFRRIQSEESPKSTFIEPVMETCSRLNLARNCTLHKSLPDLNPTKTRRRCAGKLRGASTDLGSCSECSSRSSSEMSRSSSVRLDSSTTVSESSNESAAQMAHRRSRSATGERATSDYASRSPSFKYETTSLVQSNKVWSSQPWNDCQFESRRQSAQSFEGETRRKPILRSKSDVGHSKFKFDSLPNPPSEFASDIPKELDQFFDNIGFQSSDTLLSWPGSGRSSPVYFSSVSSVDSSCKRRHVDNIYESSDSEDVAATLQRRLLGSQPGMGEPSIVERNARIIKWLIKCRNIPNVVSTSTMNKNAVQSQHNSPNRQRNFQSSLYYGQSTRL